MFHHFEPIAICDKFLQLQIRQLKHEFRREAGNVTLNGLIQPACHHMVKRRQITIKHNRLSTQLANERPYVADLHFGIDRHNFSHAASFKSHLIFKTHVQPNGLVRLIYDNLVLAYVHPALPFMRVLYHLYYWQLGENANFFHESTRSTCSTRLKLLVHIAEFATIIPNES